MTITQLLKELRQHQVVLRLEQEKLFCELPKQGIPAALRESLIARKEELKSYIASMVNELPVAVVIPRRPDGHTQVPLSFAQRRLWLMDQIDGSSAHTNMSYALTLRGVLEYAAINYAFTTILERHQSLRTRFELNDEGQPYQIIQATSEFNVAIKDLSSLPEGACQLAVAENVNNELMQRFDLSKDLMLNARLLKIANEQHVLLVTMHHIASDGWSMAILVREFGELYSAYVEDRDACLPGLDIQYLDYSHWQHYWLQSEVLNGQLSYWEKQLAGVPAVHCLPLDYPRPKVQHLNGKTFRSSIDATAQQELAALCQSQGATLFMGLQATFALLLARYTNEHDVVMGSLIANREQPEIAGLIGCFFNALVFRNNLADEPTFIELLQQSKKMLLDAYAHQQVPFEQIVERLQPERSLGYSPLFQILLIMQNNEISTLRLPGIELEFVEQQRNQVAYDLRLEITESQFELNLNWEYRTDLFKPETIQRMDEHFGLLLAAVLADPQANVFSLNMQSHEERQQLLVDFNNTEALYPEDQCLHERFEKQVNLTPDFIAVTCNEQKITYSELNIRSNQLAHYLRAKKNITTDSLVGVCIERSTDVIVAILAILKAGAAYVPLDSNYPEARLTYMLNDAKLSTVITHKYLLNSTPITPAQALCLDDDALQYQLTFQPTINIRSQDVGLQENHLAYVIYTSGSTGNPKGVAVERKGLRNLIHWYLGEYQFNVDDVFFIISAISFDLTQKNLFAPLLSGGRLVLYGHDYLDPEMVVNSIRENSATVINCAPSVFYSLIEADESGGYCALKTLRYVLLGGELINASIIKFWLEHTSCNAQIINMYGPTECTDIATSHNHKSESSGSHIGYPINNVSLYVLNASSQLVPFNVSGELCVGGIGLARGYSNYPDLTKNKFIDNPFYDKQKKNSSKKLYKTGDLVRRLADGKVEFLGRIDQQVKIRGLRIELGEIESVLNEVEAVKDAVVMVDSDACIVAYVAASVVEDKNINSNSFQDGNDLFIESLRKKVSSILPDYMVPSLFVLLESMPLTPNGKVNRKALSEIKLVNKTVGYVAPHTETERLICNILQDIMGFERVGVTDDFFKLGGNSLSALKVMSRINRDANVKLTLKSFLIDTSVIGVARLIDFMQLADANAVQIAGDELVEEGFF